MVVADLHVHTRRSDGSLALADLPAAAEASGVSVVAVTDHDRVHPDLADPRSVRDGIEVVSGIELRVQAPGQRVDLLAYGVDPTPALAAELDRIQRDRVDRGRAIVECVESRLGVTLDVDLTDGVGRPHVARAVVDHPDTVYDRMGDVFDDLIGDGDPCFVARDVPDFDRGLALLRESSTLVSLAHPFRYGDPEGALALCEHLDAVEAFYPYGSHATHLTASWGEDRRRAAIDRVVEAHDLLVTGGSDAHGTTLGGAGLTRPQWEAVAARLPPLP